MKKLISIIIMLFISVSIYSQSQIPNGNFEDWSNNEAIGWNSSIEISIFTVYTAEQTGDAYQGNYAVELESKNLYEQFVPGLITLGEIDIDNQTITGGIEFFDRPTGLSYFFKYTPLNNDTAFMISFLTKWNEANQEPDTIGRTAYFTADQFDEYTQISVPYIYNSEESPDTLNIIFISSGFSGNTSSILIIDSVAALYGTVISPTICFPASDTTSSQFTGNWLDVPNATSYSLDVSEVSNFSSFVSGYENLDIGTDTFYTVDITPGIYYYRVRVHYDTEVSINSNTIPVPAPTECTDATDITTNSFTANWQPANNATSYFIDVSTDENFETYVAPYENYSAGNNTNTVISNLDNNTEYFCRVRVEYDSFLSKNSNTVSIITETSDVDDISFNDICILSSGNIIIIHTDKRNIPKHIFIYNIHGKLINFNLSPNATEIISVKNKGIYIVRLKYCDFVINKKVVVSF